ncbi:15-hydroxyprostaglandin dehydrogenase [NAD(+)]-like [Augochlora pura]
MDQIKNMNVLITGAASGIGLSYAQHMLKNGAKTVAILDLPTSPGATSAANLEKEFGKGKAVFFQCDVTNIQQFEDANLAYHRNLTHIMEIYKKYLE